MVSFGRWFGPNDGVAEWWFWSKRGVADEKKNSRLELTADNCTLIGWLLEVVVVRAVMWSSSGFFRGMVVV